LFFGKEEQYTSRDGDQFSYHSARAQLSNTSYRMSFTTGGLYLPESVGFASAFLQCNNWKEAREQVTQQNLFMARTQKSAGRVIGEVYARLKALSEAELQLLVDGTHSEQQAVLWVAVCRAYPFIRDFAMEVLRESFLNFRGVLATEDFTYFYTKKAELEPRLDEISEQTQNRLRQVLYKMMREAGLLTDEHVIIPSQLTADCIRTIARKNPKDLMLFPVFESDVKVASQ
jgi:hypothetical protein